MYVVVAKEDLLSELLEKFILMNKDESLLDSFIFNPNFLYTLRSEFPLLKEKGFYISVIESEAPNGRYISGYIHKENKKIDLGITLVTEAGQVQAISGLKPYTDLIKFVKTFEGG